MTHTHISFYFIEDGGCESGCNPNAECVTNKCKCKDGFFGDSYTCYGKYQCELCTWASVAQYSRLSDVLPPLRSWVRAFGRASDRMWEEFGNTLPKVVGFLLVLRFRPAGKRRQGGLGLRKLEKLEKED